MKTLNMIQFLLVNSCIWWLCTLIYTCVYYFINPFDHSENFKFLYEFWNFYINFEISSSIYLHLCVYLLVCIYICISSYDFIYACLWIDGASSSLTAEHSPASEKHFPASEEYSPDPEEYSPDPGEYTPVSEEHSEPPENHLLPVEGSLESSDYLLQSAEGSLEVDFIDRGGIDYGERPHTKRGPGTDEDRTDPSPRRVRPYSSYGPSRLPG
jgi:hypothetical protein